MGHLLTPGASGSNDHASAEHGKPARSFRSFVGSKLNTDHKKQLKLANEASASVLLHERVQQPEVADTQVATSDWKKLKVAIIGAGVSGLYAALILQDLGFQPPTIYEADPNRVGGRIHTYYFTKNGANLTPKDRGYYQYVDMGAMRIPILPTMERLLSASDIKTDGPEHIGSKQANLEARLGTYGSLCNYLNARLSAEEKLQLIKYHLSDEKGNNLLLFNGRDPVKKGLKGDANQDTGFKCSEGGTVPDGFVEAGAQKCLEIVYKPLKDEIEKDFDMGFKELLNYDRFSTRFLMENFRLPLGEEKLPVVHSSIPILASGPALSGPVKVEGPYQRSVVDWLETVDSATGLYDYSFVESVMDSYDFGGDCGWHTIEGGMQRLPNAMLTILERGRSSKSDDEQTSEVPVRKKTRKSAVHFGSKVVQISPVMEGDAEKLELTVQRRNYRVDEERFDHVITTLTFGVLRTIATDGCKLSAKKELAMRTLHYDNSVKVAITFNERFWEKLPKAHAIIGGQSSTDRPSRLIVYPSSGINSDGKGVLIASYTWSQDAARMGSLSHKERVKVCLADLRKLHGADMIDKHYAGLSYTYSVDWYQAENFCGAFALYGPGQFRDLYTSALAPEVNGRLHFAGECTSVHHAWIIGSLNSAYRAVSEILERENLLEQNKQLKQRWGTVDEYSLL